MIDLSKLYETDLSLWIETVIQRIKDENFEAMDWDNLIEELEDMGASQKRAIRSYFYRLIEHLLKLRDWRGERERNEAKWKLEIINFRRSIKDILNDSPSLNNYLKDNHITWQNKVFNDYGKNAPFTITDITAIPLQKVLDEDFFC